MGRKWLFWCGILVLMGFVIGCGAKKEVVKSTSTADVDLAAATPEEASDGEREFLEQVLTKKGYDLDHRRPIVILVHKLDRRLTVYKGLTPLKTYPIVLGRNPRADKLVQGDLCTPEGVYQVVTKYPHTRWSKFILLNYPNTQNWLRFSRAKQAGKIPPTAEIGGAIGIHGTDDDLKNILGENWTWGCISLRNKDVDDIYPLIGSDTVVVIKK